MKLGSGQNRFGFRLLPFLLCSGVWVSMLVVFCDLLVFLQKFIEF